MSPTTIVCARQERAFRALTSPANSSLIATLSLFVILCVWHVNLFGGYQSGDERRHVAYARMLGKGELPTMDQTAAANHPPLYYFLASIVMTAVEDDRAPMVAVRAARYLSLTFGALALIYIFAILRLISPQYPAVAILGTVLFATMPSYINLCAAAANDSLSILAGVAMQHGGFTLLLRGVSRRRLVHLNFWLVVGSLTRFSTMLLGVPVLLMAFLAVLRRDPGLRLGQRVREATGTLLVLATVTFVIAGYFYYRNYQLYGDVTGAAKALEIFKRKSRGSPVELLFNLGLWLQMYDHFWGRLAGSISFDNGIILMYRALLLALPACAFVLLSQWETRAIRRGFWASPVGLSALAIPALCFVVLVPMFIFHARGGALNARYAFPIVWVLTGMIALGATATRSSWVPRFVAMLTLLGTTLLHDSYAATQIRKLRGFPLEAAIERAMPATPSILSCLMLLVLVGASLIILESLRRVHRSSLD